MREIVDRHFNDNWIITLYMGVAVAFRRSGAVQGCKQALSTLEIDNVRQSYEVNARALKCERSSKYLAVLTEVYVLDHINPLMNCLRRCNVTLRWLLHRRTRI